MTSDPENRFTGLPLETAYIDGSSWRVSREISYRIANGPFAGKISTVREDFITDFASVPLVFRLWYPQAGKRKQPYGLAALWHDWLYLHHAVNGEPISRVEVDRLFLEIMLYTGVKESIAFKMFLAVRLGGRWCW